MADCKNRSLCRLWILVAVLLAGSTATRGDVFSNVPEASGLTLLYQLSIPTVSGDWNSNAIPYAVNNAANIPTAGFDRVAYYLELQAGAGPLQYVYASMDAFTTSASRLGIPTTSSGAFFQQDVARMNVVSNVPGIVNGADLPSGNIEFWPSNYATTNSRSAAGGGAVPNANSGSYDFGDGGANTAAGYGSLQIHNHDIGGGQGQSLLAYNRWGVADASDMGIGNQSTDSPDWTFAQNAGDYTIKNLQVLVHETPPPTLALSSPTTRQIVQRDDTNLAEVNIEGVYLGSATSIEARAVPRAGFSGTATDWQVIDASPTGGLFDGTLTVAGGWYDLEVRSFDGANQVGSAHTDRFGVGEVFVTAGQSNSANHGDCCLTPQDDRVSAFDGNAWQFAADPQPIATGAGGSPWPALGDLLVNEFDVPVGFVSVGWGGTSVGQWQPGGSLYPRLQSALIDLGQNGARAVLWHQGESDAGSTSTAAYAAQLQNIIAQSRLDAGFALPWGVALVSYRPGAGADPNIINAQLQVIAADPLVFQGANTDETIAPFRDGGSFEGIHFNLVGLQEHGERWFDAIAPQINVQAQAGVPEPSTFALLALGAIGLAIKAHRRRIAA